MAELLLPGIWDTLRAAVVAIVLSLILGLILAMGRMSDLVPLRWATTVFVEFFRAVPVLIMMIFTFFYLSNSGPSTASGILSSGSSSD